MTRASYRKSLPVHPERPFGTLQKPQTKPKYKSGIPKIIIGIYFIASDRHFGSGHPNCNAIYQENSSNSRLLPRSSGNRTTYRQQQYHKHNKNSGIPE